MIWFKNSRHENLNHHQIKQQYKVNDTPIINDPAILKEKLTALSADILAPGDSHDKLAPAIREYSELMFDLTGVTENQDKGLQDISTNHGRAIGILRAALCTNELYRTQRFCRGLYQAVADKLKQNNTRPVHVVYAGTGPFATLALPVIMQFKPSQLQFTLLEINNESYTVLKQLLKTLDIEAFIRSFELCDAITWKAPDEDIDIVLSETMNKALIKEPQVNIMLNMVSQLPAVVTYIPEAISVGLAIENYEGPRIHLAELYNFNYNTYLKIIAQSAGQPHWVFDTTTINYSPAFNNLIYTTDITVYANEKLTGANCSLNLPHKLKLQLPAHVNALQFTYHDGQNPGFICTPLANAKQAF